MLGDMPPAKVKHRQLMKIKAIAALLITYRAIFGQDKSVERQDGSKIKRS